MTAGEAMQGPSTREDPEFDAIEAACLLPPFDRMSRGDARSALRPARLVRLRKGKALYYQGDRVRAASLLVSGGLRGLMYRSDESTIETGRSLRGEWLGLAEMLLGSPALNDEVAEEKSALLSYCHPDFDRLLERSSMMQFFLQEMARGYYVLHSRIGQNRPLDRLVRYLLSELRQKEQSAEALSRTQEGIAAAVGLTRETVNKYLHLLQREGLVAIGRGEITVLDAGALRDSIG